MYGKNYRELGRSVVTEEKKIVFISYRNRYPDAEWAEECADIVRKTYGLDIWFDKKDACLPEGSPAPEIARCVEEGLDVASALLGVISPQTFTSPWPPYEIGGARGHQRFVEPFQDWSGRFPDQSPNPLIAHLVTSGNNPEFISLGTPLQGLDDVKKWADTVSEIFGTIKRGSSGNWLLQKAYRLQEARGLRK